MFVKTCTAVSVVVLRRLLLTWSIQSAIVVVVVVIMLLLVLNAGPKDLVVQLTIHPIVLKTILI